MKRVPIWQMEMYKIAAEMIYFNSYRIQFNAQLVEKLTINPSQVVIYDHFYSFIHILLF